MLFYKTYMSITFKNHYSAMHFSAVVTGTIVSS